MFGFFKKKITKKDVIISNIGFNNVYNYCRENYDHRICDDYSDGRWHQIMRRLLKVSKNGANEDELHRVVLDGFELISPNGSPKMNFEQAAQRIADSLNKLKGEKFEEARRNVIASKFNENNIEESIRISNENISS